MSGDTADNSIPGNALQSKTMIATGGLVLAAGVLIGLGAIALLRGLHLYLHFYSYASGMATSRWYQTLVWSVAGGIVLSFGVVLLLQRPSRPQ